MASEDLPANGHGGPADPSAKRDLRRRYRAARAAYVAGLSFSARDGLQRDLADRLADRLPTGRIAAYHAMADEIDPCGIGRPLAFPRVVRDGPLMFHDAPRAAGRTGSLGVPEPAADTPQVVPDVILVPLIAVDRFGTRLGQGGGHYDRTLAALRAFMPVFAVGVAWDTQLVDTLPADRWDEALDALATPTQWLTFAPPLPK